MPFLTTNGIRLSYQRSGAGIPVVLIMGSSASGRVWTMHQTPALNRAGYETITFDNRGIPPSSAPPGDYRIEDMAADTMGLIETLRLAPCHVVGTSLGAMVAQELAIQRPALLRSMVLIATRARDDVMRAAMYAADEERRALGVNLPLRYEAVRTALEMLSPATLDDESTVGDWLELLELTGTGRDRGTGQSAAGATIGDRRPALGKVNVPARAIAFADDLICPPHMVAEVAGAIPECDLVRIENCGHLGYLERPDAVNDALIEFLDKY